MTLQATMTAIAIDGGAGPATALHAVQQPVPQPRSGEILIRVRAAGVNRPDLLQRSGNYPPPPGAPASPSTRCRSDRDGANSYRRFC